ncbi:MAG: class I adenylate-forming enzyme family protein [Hyphomonadaceae bacterium]
MTQDWRALGLRPAEGGAPIPGGPRDVCDALLRVTAATPDALALISRHARFTFAQLRAHVEALAFELWRRGVRPGDRVAACAGNHAEIAVAFFAAQRISAVWVGVNRNLAPPEKRFILNDSGARLLFADTDVLDALGEDVGGVSDCIDMAPASEAFWRLCTPRGEATALPAVDPHAPAAIAYTSGTTGFPKGVVHSQHNMVLVGAVARAQGRAGPGLRQGVALPLTILNLVILGPLQSMIGGGVCILMDRLDTLGLADWIAREQVHTFAATPAMIHDLITRPDIPPHALECLKEPRAGGAALPESFRQLYRDRFGVDLQFSYGLTEAPTVVCLTDYASHPAEGASGVALPHLELGILAADATLLGPGESGEICLRASPGGAWAEVYTPMLGYWRRPDATEAALAGGWLHTGDIGKLDEFGNLFVEGRANDVIVRGGANIYPAEIERVLHMDDQVAGCAVIGAADARLGEVVVAFVQSGADTVALEARLRELCDANLARYKHPSRWIFVDDLPRNTMNKVIKAELRARLSL